MSEFDVTLCKFYDNEICYNEEYPIKYCDGYQCIYKEISLLREHCKFIDEANKILNDAKESLLKENEELKETNHNLSEKFANVCGGCFEQELREKYEQCLDEIENCIECCTTTMYGCGNCKKGYECNGTLSDLILQKIKEVKGE